MASVFIIHDENVAIEELGNELARSWFVNFASSRDNHVTEEIALKTPDMVVIELTESPEVREIVLSIKEDFSIPVIGLVNRDMLDLVSGNLAIDDFLVSPWDTRELQIRGNRLLAGNTAAAVSSPGAASMIFGELTIDEDQCEVFLFGKPVLLTFREYELLKFLAKHPGRVFSRDSLLNEVWGYDYYGGDRTVDVHIRRLRSKIEESGYTFIETVRNIGYRFRAMEPDETSG